MLAPTVPPAPGRFSMMNVFPSCRPTWSITTRAMMSLALPGGERHHDGDVAGGPFLSRCVVRKR
jgi:hypothetical protein